jgi:hypothetical protein
MCIQADTWQRVSISGTDVDAKLDKLTAAVHDASTASGGLVD